MRQCQDRMGSSEDWENEGGSLSSPRDPTSSGSMTELRITFDAAVTGLTAAMALAGQAQTRGATS